MPEKSAGPLINGPALNFFDIMFRQQDSLRLHQLADGGLNVIKNTTNIHPSPFGELRAGSNPPPQGEGKYKE